MKGTVGQGVEARQPLGCAEPVSRGPVGHSGSVEPIGQPHQLRIRGTIGVDPIHDLAILSIRDLSAPGLALYTDSVPVVGSRVYAVGNPKGLEGTFSDGIVSGIRALRGDTLLQITAPISPGSSGGPVLDGSGRVVGVAVATLQDGQNLNFAVPVRYVSALLSAPTALRPLMPSRRRAGEGPAEILGGLGGKSVDGVMLGSLSWDPRLDPGFGENKLWFSLRNGLRQRVSHIQYLLIFYDTGGQVLDAREAVTYAGDFIRPGLAAREFINVTRDIRQQTGRIAYRILDFTLEKE